MFDRVLSYIIDAVIFGAFVFLIIEGFRRLFVSVIE
jgi:hypothetical protein